MLHRFRWSIIASATIVFCQAGPSRDYARDAAEITLLVLRATVAGTFSQSRYVALPSRAPLNHSAAAEVLGAMKKPVHCDGFSQGITLTVDCRQLGDSAMREWPEKVAFDSGYENDRRTECPGPASQAMVLIYNGRDSLEVAFPAFAQWLRDYEVAATLGTETDKPQGICMVIHVQQVPEIKIQQSTSPPHSKTDD